MVESDQQVQTPPQWATVLIVMPFRALQPSSFNSQISMKMISKSVRLEEDQIEALERDAARSKKSFNGIVREAVDELLAVRFGKGMAAIASR